MALSTYLSGTARLALVALAGSALGACSSDATRFGDPFSNPFTGSLPAATAPAAPDYGATGSIPSAASTRVESRDLAPPTGQPRAAASAPAPVATGPAGWSTAGGTSVTLGAGDSVAALSTRYGVPESAIRTANGLGLRAEPSPGSRVVIPVLRQGGPTHAAVGAPTAGTPRFVEGPRPVESVRAPAASEAKAPRTAAKPDEQPAHARAKDKAAAKRDEVATRAQPAKPAPGEPAAATLAQAPAPRQPEAPKPRTPEAKPTAAKPVEAKAAPAAAKLAVKAPEPAPEKVAAKAEAAKPETSKPETSKPETSKPEPEAKAESGEFRWPARGRIIQGFGESNGQKNDGINIAVPSGTPVRAAETGTVAYAGEELKGYGKLVLVRHADGWVSAYAHNGELDVKKGDTVKRGQVIAKSGQTGNVASPQLHFELRKGSSPVDPTTRLAN